MTKVSVFCCLLILSATAVADNLNKCIDPKDGRAVFTTQPCAAFGLKTNGAFIFSPYETVAKQSAGMMPGQKKPVEASGPSVDVMLRGNSGHCAALEAKQKKLATETSDAARKKYAEAVAQFKAKCH